MELVRRYSNRADLQELLRKATQRTSREERPGTRDDSFVTGRASSVWRLSDRLSDEDVLEIINRFQAGTPKRMLALEFAVSLSSIKTLLRQSGVRRDN